MTMHCCKSPGHPPLFTRLLVLCFGCCAGKKKRSPANQTFKDKWQTHTARFPRPSPRTKNSKNIRMATQISKSHQNQWKSVKNKRIQQNTKSKGKRPKANVSSHNTCHYGYPFFLCPSDDDSMLEVPNPPCQNFRYYCFGGCASIRKRNTTQQKPQQNNNSETSETRTLHISPGSQKWQEYKNGDNKFKIARTSMKCFENALTKRKTKSRGKRPKANISFHSACRYGYPFFLSPSDDDAMLEIPNPPSLSTKLFVSLLCRVVRAKRKEARLRKKQQKQQRNNNSRTSETRTLRLSPESPKFQEYQNGDPHFKVTPKFMKIHNKKQSQRETI